jgi:hypothetical protein
LELVILAVVGVVVVAILKGNEGPTVDVFAQPDAVDAPSDSPSFTDNIVQSNSAPDRLTQWAQAIFHFEGGNPGNLNVRNNNPGNLKFAGQPNATEGDKGFAVFPSLQDGFAALNAQLMKYLNDFPNLTLTQFEARYLGQTDYLNPRVTDQGDPFTYAQAVADKLGVSPDQTLSQIFGGV